MGRKGQWRSVQSFGMHCSTVHACGNWVRVQIESKVWSHDVDYTYAAEPRTLRMPISGAAVFCRRSTRSSAWCSWGGFGVGWGEFG